MSGTSPQMQNNRYEIINLFREGDGGGSIGWYLNEPLTTTQWLSGDENDTHFFRKIDLDDNSYALIFAGWFFNQGHRRNDYFCNKQKRCLNSLS